ncbi:DUF4184 family protein [Bacillus mobilis]|uniref:DUF4184 family protein n=2 Tax=Bacillus cereus group TaxID=86661 RepID=A0A1C4EM39_BACCE|nr:MULTISPECIES: DUF4184 family protein [Bacillus cereus group]MCU5590803.1 DUF4184 family protein [Bacillus mobilis]MCU5734413.1 DUF4184 family protein [Bacillus mobilis]MCU9557088.1 DUF4184 family protein [Bacillus mobilis]OKA39936.1 hypothetical protein BJR06_06505 [Bacillus cereus]OKA41815.1 hypothetical protein BJR07_07855 [Bacillus cereus]
MPFTFAHPAAILPFTKRNSSYISVTALILGSMAPDFEYFLHFRPYGIIGHTWLGFLYLNLPLAGYFAYAVDERWGLHTWKDFFVFCYSALFGMLTHVVWDAFTHHTGYFVMKIALLQRELQSISVYKYMQHGSTCVGLLLLLYVLWKYKDETGKDIMIASEKRKYWVSVIIVAALIFIVHAFVDPYFHIFQIGGIIVSGLTSSFCGLLIVSIVYKARD